MITNINRETLRGMIDRGEDFVLLETLPSEEYEKGHIPGAKNMPPDRVEELAPSLIPGKDTDVVVYCASFDCNASSKAARKLEELGYTSIFDYEGGKADWKEARLATV